METTPLVIQTYRALISQTGTSAPTAIILQNTFEDTITWQYSAVGQYVAIIPVAYNQRLWAILQNNTNVETTFKIVRIDHTAGWVIINTKSGATLTNGLLVDTPIEIKLCKI